MYESISFLACSPPTRTYRDSAAEMARLGATALLSERIEDVLKCSPYPPLRGLSWSLHNGTVTLWGPVPSFYCKQLAQTLVAAIRGVRQIDNRLEVVAPDPRWSMCGVPLGRDPFGPQDE